MDIYIPTYLYIKRHTVTGILYFGMTRRKDPIKYSGSGIYWKRHIKMHGLGSVETIWLELFHTKEDLIEFSTFFSEFFDIVGSDKWANLMQETGDLGLAAGFKHSEKSKLQMSETHKIVQNSLTDEDKIKRSIRTSELHKGKTVSQETKLKLSIAAAGKPRSFSQEHIENMKIARRRNPKRPNAGQHMKINRPFGEDNAFFGKHHTEETKKILSDAARSRPKFICCHCGLECTISNLTRWHNDNCKLKP